MEVTGRCHGFYSKAARTINLDQRLFVGKCWLLFYCDYQIKRTLVGYYKFHCYHVVVQQFPKYLVQSKVRKLLLLWFQSFVLTCLNTCFSFWLYFQTSSGTASSPNISDLENWWEKSNIYTHHLSAHRHTRTLHCQKCTGISIWNTHTRQSGTQYHARKIISYVAEVNNECTFLVMTQQALVF